MGGFLHAESEFAVEKCQILHPEPKNRKKNEILKFLTVLCNFGDSRHVQFGNYIAFELESEAEVKISIGLDPKAKNQ